MMIPRINIVEINRYSELQQQEDQIIGKLFRDLVPFEYEMYNTKTILAIRNVIMNARNHCKSIGSDETIIDSFLNRMSVYIGANKQIRIKELIGECYETNI